MFSRDKAEQQATLPRGESRPDSERLALLQSILVKLLVRLDIDNSIWKPEKGQPEWAQAGRYPELED